MRRARLLATLRIAWLALAVGAGVFPALPGFTANGVPRPDHVVIVIEENHSYSEIIGNAAAPYMNSLANSGASFTQSFAVTHPSEPNYLALFSGSTQGIADDSCPHTFTTPNLGAELITAGLKFGGYSEDLPSTGSTVCQSGSYYRKHNPWVNWQGQQVNGILATDNMPFSSFPTDFTTLPTVSIVVPNQLNDMHDGTIQQADTWLQQHLDAYIQWAKTHNSLFILTWDEDDGSQGNRIPTIFVGPATMLSPGQYSETINHYNVLRTIEDMYGLTYAGNSATATPITDIWTTSLPAPSNLIATAISSSEIDLSWTDNSASESGFKIERSPDGTNFTQVDTAGANVTFYANTGLAASTTYTYRVRAYDATGNSAYSNTASATTPGGGAVPAAPSNLRAKKAPGNSHQINLTWTDNSNNETGFKIERSTDNFVTFTQIAAPGANATSYQDTGLAAGVTYYYRVRATNAAGDSAPSNTASARG